MSIDLTLGRIHKLLSHLPSYTRPTVHIAGTNGKGSVSTLVSSILHESSPPFKVGRFNSPHLVSVHDSIAINDVPVSPSTYSAVRDLVDETDRKYGVGASSFERLASTALVIFEQQQVDVVVLEVGMGGRLDATNVVSDECIAVSALTAVDLDHQAFLGYTVAAIAREKAAIARPGKPFVLGPQKYPEVEEVASEVVGSLGGKLIRAGVAVAREWDEEVDGPRPEGPTLSPECFIRPPPRPVQISLPCFSEPVRTLLPLQGEHQMSNLGVALHIISALITYSNDPSTSALQLRQRLTPSAISRGIRTVSWPGRLSFHHIRVPISSDSAGATKALTVLADGAHNPASSATLAEYVSSLLTSFLAAPEPLSRCEVTLTYILALSDSPPKTPLQTLTPLLPPALPDSNPKIRVRVALLRFTPPDGMPWIKSVPPSVLRDTVSSLMPDAEVWSRPDDEVPNQVHLLAALQWAEADSTSSQSLVVVAGSLYLVADFYRLIRGGRLRGNGSTS